MKTENFRFGSSPRVGSGDRARPSWGNQAPAEAIGEPSQLGRSPAFVRCVASTVSFGLPQPRLMIASAAVILADHGQLSTSKARRNVASAKSVSCFAAIAKSWMN
jgi:hypothetical protein